MADERTGTRLTPEGAQVLLARRRRDESATAACALPFSVSDESCKPAF
jgi:hypothetical protein